MAGAQLLSVSQDGDIVTASYDGELSNKQNDYVNNLG